MTRAEAGLLIGGLATALLIGYAGIRRDRSVSPGQSGANASTAAGSAPGVIVAPWLGCDMLARLGPLSPVAGHSDTLPVPAPPLRLWIVVAADECLACREALPITAAALDSLTGPGPDAVAVACGDRHESRRTFWGFEPKMPLLACPDPDLPAGLGLKRTPVRLLSWYGRVVAVSTEPAGSATGRRWLRTVLERFAGSWSPL